MVPLTTWLLLLWMMYDLAIDWLQDLPVQLRQQMIAVVANLLLIEVRIFGLVTKIAAKRLRLDVMMMRRRKGFQAMMRLLSSKLSLSQLE